MNYLLLCKATCIKTLAVSLLVVLFYVPCSAQVVPNRDEWLVRDPRLKQTVTITRYHVRIGELLEEASRQSGVALSANRLDGGDSEVITVYARKIALVDLLSNVWSLMSYQQAAWRWEVDGDGKKIPYSYKLIYPKNAKDFPLAIAEEVGEYFESSMEATVGAIDASSKERAIIGEKYPEAKLLDDPLQNKMLKTFRSLTTKQERAKLAHGETKKSIPRSEWTPETKDYVDATISFLTKEAGKLGTTYDRPYPENVTLNYLMGDDSLLPNLWIGIEGVTGWSVIGGIQTDSYWRARLEDRWIMEGDSKKETVSESIKIPVATLETKRTYRSAYDNPLQDQLNDFNKLTGISLFARGGDLTLLPFYEKPVGEFVANLRSRSQSVKWRNGSLFVAPTIWIRRATQDAESQVPWTVMQRFRQSVAGRADYNCNLEDVVALAHDLTPKQIDSLQKSDELFPPNLFIPTWAILNEIKGWRSVLAPLGRNEELLRLVQTKNGVRIRELPQEMRDRLAPFFANEKIPAEARLRIRTHDVPLDEWKIIAKKQDQEGDAIPRAFFVETVDGDKVEMLTSIWWAWRRVAELHTNRIQPEIDMRRPFLKIDEVPSN